MAKPSDQNVFRSSPLTASVFVPLSSTLLFAYLMYRLSPWAYSLKNSKDTSSILWVRKAPYSIVPIKVPELNLVLRPHAMYLSLNQSLRDQRIWLVRPLSCATSGAWEWSRPIQIAWTRAREESISKDNQDVLTRRRGARRQKKGVYYKYYFKCV